MKYIGFFFYIMYRIFAITVNKFIGFIIASYLKISAKRCGSVKISGFGRFMCISNLQIGNNVGINFGAYWVCDGGLSIGDNCRFAKNVTIYTRNHNYNGELLPYDESNIYKPVVIGRNVWVGTNVTILPGSIIHDGVIIGAGCVVHGEIPKCSIVGASGLKILKQRDMEKYEELDKGMHYHKL